MSRALSLNSAATPSRCPPIPSARAPSARSPEPLAGRRDRVCRCDTATSRRDVGIGSRAATKKQAGDAVDEALRARRRGPPSPHSTSSAASASAASRSHSVASASSSCGFAGMSSAASAKQRRPQRAATRAATSRLPCASSPVAGPAVRAHPAIERSGDVVGRAALRLGQRRRLPDGAQQRPQARIEIVHAGEVDAARARRSASAR